MFRKTVPYVKGRPSHRRMISTDISEWYRYTIPVHGLLGLDFYAHLYGKHVGKSDTNLNKSGHRSVLQKMQYCTSLGIPIYINYNREMRRV